MLNVSINVKHQYTIYIYIYTIIYIYIPMYLQKNHVKIQKQFQTARPGEESLTIYGLVIALVLLFANPLIK